MDGAGKRSEGLGTHPKECQQPAQPYNLAECCHEVGAGRSTQPAALRDSCTFPLLLAQASLDVLNCPKVDVPEPEATCQRDPGQEPDTDTSHSGSTLGARKLQRTRT